MSEPHDAVPPARTDTDPSAPDRALSLYQRYQPWRRGLEVGFWVINIAISATGNTITVGMEMSRAGLDFHPAEPAIWEWSSALTFLVLVPAMVWFTRRWPPLLSEWRTRVPLYLFASVAFSLLHVLGMVALRKL